MRKLDTYELSAVSGGGDVADAAQVGVALGAAGGASFAISSGATGTAVLGAAGIGGAIVGGFSVALVGGYSIGQFLNNNTPIQSWISSAVSSIGGIFKDTKLAF